MLRLAKFTAFALAGAMLYVAPAHAQATRTWVSGVGDDVNPCSRTAPCKTFAGAISKTAVGGEINCLDPAGYGAVTINKALTINCQYTEGGVLAAGNGIVVNAGPTDVIYLRGLDIFGVSPPSNGVRILVAGAVHIEDSTIRRFNAANSFGISFQPSGATQLYVSNTTIAENGSGATGGGILIQPTGAGGSGQVTLDNVRIQNNANTGIRMDSVGNTNVTGTRATIVGGQISGSPTGLSVHTQLGNSFMEAMVRETTLASNTTAINSDGSAAMVRIGSSVITANTNGLNTANGGQIRSYGTNQFDGNTNPTAFTPPTLPPQ